MLGVFAKVVRGQPVKSRLQTQLSRQEAEDFYVASLADTLETALDVCDTPILFLQGGEDSIGVDELKARLAAKTFTADMWAHLKVQAQVGRTLGARLENAFDVMARISSGSEGAVRPAIIIGSDSPSLTSALVRSGLQRLSEPQDVSERPDVVLGPTADGGYWVIGVRRPLRGLLTDVAWSTTHTLADTVARCRTLDLRVELLEAWTDVDHPEDLRTLQGEILALRARGDVRTARRVETVLRGLVSSSG